MTRRYVLAILLVGYFTFPEGCSAFADSFTFSTLYETGDISGPAGFTIGWGYTLTHTSLTNCLVLTALSADPFVNGVPIAIFDFPILAPGATITIPFDALYGFGLHALTWDLSVLPQTESEIEMRIRRGIDSNLAFDGTRQFRRPSPFV
jgi:hypothetical protein